MAQTEEEKKAAQAAKEAEAKKLADAAEATAKKEAERIAKEDAIKAEKAKAERAEKAELALQAQEAREAAGDTQPVADVVTPAPEVVTPAAIAEEINVLPMHDVVEKNDDVYIYENIRLPKEYAGEKGVKKFEGTNGQVIYYTPVLVKKFSDNVVTDGSTEDATEE